MMQETYHHLKPALTYEKQVARLKTIHNLTISDETAAIRILQKVNYYRLSAYGIGLKKSATSEKYRDDITLEHIFRLYCFDSEFRNIIVHIVEQLEIQIRTQIAYTLAIHYGPEGYTAVTNFEDKFNRRGDSIHESVMNHFQKEVNRNQKLPFVKHHMKKYGGHFPIWVAVELMTFGNLTSLYDIMKRGDQKTIASFYGTSPNHLKSWLLALVEIRNICAHYDRLYNMPLKQTPFLYSENKKYRTIPNKVFPIFLVIQRMLHSNEQWHSFLKEIIKCMDQYSDVVNLSFIGFPHDWKEKLSSPIGKSYSM